MKSDLLAADTQSYAQWKIGWLKGPPFTSGSNFMVVAATMITFRGCCIIVRIVDNVNDDLVNKSIISFSKARKLYNLLSFLYFDYYVRQWNVGAAVDCTSY